MEAERAHELYTLFQRHDAGAKQKQGLGFAGSGGGGARGEYRGGDDDVVARNKRLYGGSSARDEEQEAGYDSDSATAVVRRLKQLKREHGKGGPDSAGAVAAAVAEAALAARRGSGRGAGSSRGEERGRREGEQGGRERHGGSGGGGGRREEDGRERQRSSRGREEEDAWRGSSDRRQERDTDRGRDEYGSRGGSQRDRWDEDRHHHQHYSSSRGEDSRRHSSSSQSRRDRERELDWQRGSSRGERNRDRDRPGSGSGASRPQAPAAPKPDFERLIPGYSGMTAAQKLKARTQFLLERSAQQDKRRAEWDSGDGQWTRFRFDDNAYLDEEGGRPAEPTEGGDEGEGASPGRRAINTVTFKASVAHAEMQGRDASHADAIFGRPPALAAGGGEGERGGSRTAQAGTSQAGVLGFKGGRGAIAAVAGLEGERFAGLGSSGGGGLGWGQGSLEPVEEEEAAVPAEQLDIAWEAGAGASGVAEGGPTVVRLDEGAAGKQAQLGWRERAALLKAQRAKQA